MDKWFGEIGITSDVSEEYERGKYRPKVMPYEFYGEILENRNRNQSTDKINDNLTISNKISILANQIIGGKIHAIVYATYMGTKWKVDSVETKGRRIILSLGGVYHG